VVRPESIFTRFTLMTGILIFSAFALMTGNLIFSANNFDARWNVALGLISRTEER